MSGYEAPILLTDAQMRAYLTEGYLVLRSQVPGELHAHIHRRCEEIFASTGNPGNEILALNPALQVIFSDPVVKGALDSILGEGHFMHPHRHCHRNVSGTPAQRNHRDSYEEDINVHHPRSRWAMAMYYPQRVTADMGPTGVTPGSQYFSDRESLASRQELGVTGVEGTVILVHYDIWHRALRNTSGRHRYMLKFLFCRATEPTAPAWDSRKTDWQTPDHPKDDGLDPLWQALWRWNRGESLHDPGQVDAGVTLSDLRSPSEPERLRAAYTIAPRAFEPRQELFRLWKTEADQVEKSARQRDHFSPCEHAFGYALGGLGAAGLNVLTEALSAEDWRIRGSAVDTAGDIGLEARSLAPRAIDLLHDTSPWVRRNAAEALGTLGDSSGEVTQALGQALTDRDYWVGHNAALSLRKLGRAEDSTVDALMRAAAHPELYRRQNALMALEHLLR